MAAAPAVGTETPQKRPAAHAPRAVVEAAQRYHAEHRVEQLRELLAPDGRADVLDLLDSVSRVAIANQKLQTTLKARLGEAVALRFDRSQIVNAVGPFSPAAKVIDEQVDGEHAVVTYQIAERVPLNEVGLLLRDGRWLIRTDTPISGLAPEMRNLADALLAVAERVESEKFDAEAIAKELELRQRPILDRIAAITQKK